MPDGVSQSPESSISTKVKEAPKKLQKRVGPKEVKGFYYHAAEYQRARQKERNGVLRILSGIAEPLTIHIRAFRLWNEARRKGGGGKGWVLDNEFTKKALEGKLSEKEIKQFRAKSEAHAVFEQYRMDKDDEARAKEVMAEVFGKKGQLTKEDMQALQEKSGLSFEDIANLAATARENAGGYQTVEEIKGKFSDEAILGGLTQEQQRQAKKLARSAWANSIVTALNYGKTAAVVAIMASNPVGWAIAGITVASAGMSALTRWTRLSKEGQTHFISKAKGIDVAHKIRGLERFLGVDWDEDPAKIGQQMTRAVLAGALVALGARFVPTIWEHLSEGASAAGTDIHNVLDHISMPKPTADSQTAVALLHGQELKMPAFHEHLSGYEQPVKTSFLPDTTHHDWQQLHTFVNTVHDAKGNVLHDAQGNPLHELKLSYNGVDDGIPHDQHYVDLMMPDGKQVFLQNDSVLALNGPDADKFVNIFGLVHEHGHTSFEQIGQIHSSNLAHQLGLDQGKIDHFATLTSKAHGGLWHGTQDASDLQRIMFDRNIYNDGANGQALFGVRIGGGYYDAANHVFKIGASNHYFDHSLLTDKLVKDYNIPLPTAPSLAEEAPEFHSAIAGPLQTIDNGEDWLIDRFHNSVFSDSFSRHLDEVSDYGLHRADFDALTIQGRPWLAPLVLTPYAALGFAGYLYGKNRLDKKLTLPRAGFNTLAEGALFLANPGFAATATLGYLLAKLRRKKKGDTVPVATSVNPETSPGGNPSGGIPAAAPSDAGVAPTSVPSASTAQPVPPPTSPIPSTVAGPTDDDTPVAPAPLPPEGLRADEPAEEIIAEDTLPGTAAAEEPTPVAPPAPFAVRNEATIPVEESQSQALPPVEDQAVAAVPSLEEENPPAEDQASATVPVETENLDIPAATAAIAESDQLKNTAPFDELTKEEGTDSEKEAKFKEGLVAHGATKVLTKLLTPVADKLGIPSDVLEERVNGFVTESGKLERLTSFILVANRLWRIAQNPEALKEVLGKVSEALAAHAGEAKETVTAAVKDALASSGEAGAELAALGEEALPVIEEVAPLLA